MSTLAFQRIHFDAPISARAVLRNLARVIGGIFAFLVCAIILLIAFFNFSGYAQHYATDASGRPIDLGKSTKITWGPITHIHMDNVHVANMKGGSALDMFSAQSIDIALDLRALLRGHVVLPEISLQSPSLLMEKDAAGNANWHFGSNPGAKAVTSPVPQKRYEVPAIGRLAIQNGRFAYKDAGQKIDISSDISTVIGSAKEDERIHLSGKGNYKGKPFHLDMVGGSVLTLKDTSTPYPLKAGFEIADTAFGVAGTMTDPLQLKGMELRLRIKGNDAADIFPIFGIALPPTPPYDVTGDLGLKDKVWSFTDFKGKLGSSDLEGSLSWDTNKKRPLLTANFTSNYLAFQDLGPLIGEAPAPGKAVSAKQQQRKEHQDVSPFVIPDTSLDISRLSAMDANVSFTGKKVISSSLPLDNFYLHAILDDRVLKLAPLKFGTADGDISANLTANARVTPIAIDGDFTFHRLSLARLLAPVRKSLPTVPARGFIGGKATLSGTGKSLHEMLGNSHGTVGFGMEGGQLSDLLVQIIGLDVAKSLGFLIVGDKPTAIRCVIGDFGVTDGQMKAKSFVVDTTGTNIQGSGSLNLKNEQLDFHLMPHPKGKSILSLRSPLHITGTLKSPNFGFDAKGLVVKGGVGAALGAVLLPLGVLAFVEPGLGKDSDCAGLVTQLNHDTGAEAHVPKNNPIAPPRKK